MRHLLLPLLSAQLTASHQYLLDAKMLEAAGHPRLAGKLGEVSRERLRQAEQLLDRLRTSGQMGLGDLTSGSDLREQLRQALHRETECVRQLNLALDQSLGDAVWQAILSDFRAQHESFIDFLEAQLSQLKELGYPRYLIEQS